MLFNDLIYSCFSSWKKICCASFIPNSSGGPSCIGLNCRSLSSRMTRCPPLLLTSFLCWLRGECLYLTRRFTSVTWTPGPWASCCCTALLSAAVTGWWRVPPISCMALLWLQHCKPEVQVSYGWIHLNFALWCWTTSYNKNKRLFS